MKTTKEDRIQGHLTFSVLGPAGLFTYGLFQNVYKGKKQNTWSTKETNYIEIQ